MKISVQINGKFCDEIDIQDGEEITRDVWNRSPKVRIALDGIAPFEIVKIPKKLINLITKPPSGAVYRMREWQTPDGEWHKSFEQPMEKTEMNTDYICSECNWGNSSLLNLGEFNKPRWVCHGCCKLAIEARDESLSALKDAQPLILRIVVENPDDAEARQLLDRIDTFLKSYQQLLFR